MSAHLTFSSFAAVGAGAAVGAWVRWGLGLMLNYLFPLIPIGTLVANLTGPPVNARRREIVSRAFGVYCLPGKGLRRFFRVPKCLWLEIREIESGTNHRGWTRTPES